MSRTPYLNLGEARAGNREYPYSSTYPIPTGSVIKSLKNGLCSGGPSRYDTESYYSDIVITCCIAQ